jgi:hypothetical protein
MALYDKASLVLIPSGTKEGVCFSQKPTNGDGDFTFTRASSATRVNSDGLIEKETQNLLLYSEQFDNPYWNKTSYNGGGVPSVTANYGASPIGTNTADRVQFPVCAGSEVSSLQTPISFAYPLLTSSIYVRSVSGTCSNLVLRSGGTEYAVPSFGTSWTRIETFSQSNGANEGLAIRNRPSTSGDGSAIDIMVWGAQLNQGLVADSYLETTTTAVYGGITDNIPRLDYTDASCPSLLLEPQRTNIIDHSEYIDNLYHRSGSIITTNYGISPEGVQNSTRVQRGTSYDGYQYFRYTVSPSTTYTMSIYAKGSGTIRFNFYDGTSAQTNSLTNLTSEWVRYSFTATSNSTTSMGDFGFFISDDAEVYGFQLEESSYVTSYIPTYGASVTRNSDITYKYNATSIVGTTEGVMFIDCVPPANDNPILMQLINNTSIYSQSIYFEYAKSINKIRCNAYDSGVLQASFELDATIGNQYKIALAYKENDFAFYVNGSLVGTDTNASVQSGLQDVLIGVLKGSFGSYNFIGNDVNQAILFKTRLSNEELADLTTI